MAEFDRFAREYKDLLDRSTAFSGESSEYFCQYKANYVTRTVGYVRYSRKFSITAVALERCR